MKHILCAALACLLVSSLLAGCSQPAPSTPASSVPASSEPTPEPTPEPVKIVHGTWDEGTYSNAWLGIRFTLPEGWYALTEAEIKNTMDPSTLLDDAEEGDADASAPASKAADKDANSKAADADSKPANDASTEKADSKTAGKDADSKPAADADGERAAPDAKDGNVYHALVADTDTYEFYVTSEDGFATFYLDIFNKSEAGMPDMTPKEHLKMLGDSFASLEGDGYTFRVGEPKAGKLGGLDCQTLDIVMEMTDLDMEMAQNYYVLEQDGYLLVYYVSSFGDDYEKDIDALLKQFA